MEPLFDSGGRPVTLAVEVQAPSPPVLLPECRWQFPDPALLDAYGCAGRGADFAPETVLAAYKRGIFPWPHPADEYLWFSPDPRAVFEPGRLHISRRLGRTIRSGGFRVTQDAAFEEVMRACADRPEEERWITPDLIAGYCQLHRAGWAHSFEVWDDAGRLTGGLYGVGIGTMFGAESMFHRATGASKVAMVALALRARELGVEFIDVQVLNGHTARMGAAEISRAEYLARLRHALTGQAAWHLPAG